MLLNTLADFEVKSRLNILARLRAGGKMVQGF
jgi:hypothetical protein